MSTDFYPSSQDARAAWHLNFATNLPGLTAKYGISSATLASVAADNTWMQYWVGGRHTLDTSSQQMTKYFNTIAGNDSTAPAPAPFAITLPDAERGAPAEVPPGIEKRVRDLARDIKGRSNYAKADGELLGIEAPANGGPSGPTGITKPAITLTTRVAFEVGVKFRKLGMTGIRLEYRHAGGNWLPAGSLFTSPGTFQVTPTTPNTPEQIEVRAVYLQGNTPTGDYSDTGSVYVGP